MDRLSRVAMGRLAALCESRVKRLSINNVAQRPYPNLTRYPLLQLTSRGDQDLRRRIGELLEVCDVETINDSLTTVEQGDFFIGYFAEKGRLEE